MKELVTMLILFLTLLIFQLKEQRQIIIQSYKSKFHFIMYILLFIAILLLFKQDNLINQLKLIIFAGLVFNFGVQKEGLGDSKFIKAGYVFSSNYKKYNIIKIDSISESISKVKLKKNKNDNGISLILKESPYNIKNFFKEMPHQFLIEIKE